jgi:hypothetical protein
MRTLAVSIVVVLVFALSVGVAFAGNGNGNGAPSGAHYNLNFIGVGNYGHKQCNNNDNFPDADMSNNGHRIFVDLCGNTKIMLSEACENCDDVLGSFQVLDANGTDGQASFALPNPDPDGDGETVYSVFARALGKPGGSGHLSTCATYYYYDDLGVLQSEEVCSMAMLTVERVKGQKPRFENVSKELLYIYADLDGDGSYERYPLFDDALEGYFWSYDNNGLKVVQLRFYECTTIVPDQYGDPIVDTTCYNGN